MLKLKSLWLIRIYVMILEIAAELALIFYIFASFAFFVKNESSGLAQVIMGGLGLTIVLSALGVLFLSQIIKLFLGIHDNISDIRVKTLNPEVSIPIAKKSELEYYNDVIQIVLILLSIVIMLIQFTAKGKSSNSNNNTSQMEQSSNGQSIQVDLPTATPAPDPTALPAAASEPAHEAAHEAAPTPERKK